MGAIHEPEPVKLVASLIWSPGADPAAVWPRLQEYWGPLDFISAPQPFGWTDYYGAEMGEPLKRCFVAWQKPIRCQRLIGVKHRANALEEEWAREGRRRFNLDPGYLAPEKLVLATTKNYAHRPYLGRGIFADLTLIWRGGGYQPLEWTYPDYASEGVRAMFNRVRRVLLRQLRAGRRAGARGAGDETHGGCREQR